MAPRQRWDVGVHLLAPNDNFLRGNYFKIDLKYFPCVYIFGNSSVHFTAEFEQCFSTVSDIYIFALLTVVYSARCIARNCGSDRK